MIPDDSPNAEVLQDNRRGAIFSDDREYRYRLWRMWDAEKPTLAFIMLNPSTADETENDPTIRRCLGFAKAWGYGRLEVGNLFALRATDPSELREHEAPIGGANDVMLRQQVVSDADLVVAAWGNHGELSDRGLEVARMLEENGVDLHALDTTQSGQPVHPLRQPGDLEPEPFDPEVIEA